MHSSLLLWGKTLSIGEGYPLLFHMLDCAAVALEWLLSDRALLSSFREMTALKGSDEELATFYSLITALHDIGKATVIFQNKRPSLAEGAGIFDDNLSGAERFNHGLYGHYWLDKRRFSELRGGFKEQIESWKDAGLLELVVGLWKAACWHHGRIGFEGSSVKPIDPQNGPSSERLRELRSEMLSELAHTLVGEKGMTVEATGKPDPALFRIFAGFVSVCDWLASSPALFNDEATPGSDIAEHLRRGRGKAALELKRLAFISPRVEESKPESFFSLFNFKEYPRDIQKRVEEMAPSLTRGGLLIIEAPTGEGKTEAALYCHYRLGSRGLYFALPTQATANQLYGRVVRFYNDSLKQHLPIALAHGAAWLNEAYSLEQKGHGEWGEWFFSRKKTLLSPVAVGTVDQAMTAVLNVKHYFVKLFALAGKTLIIDEVHAYDAFMQPALKRLLSWCRHLKITVILLSATLPQAMKRELINSYRGRGGDKTGLSAAYPLITYVQEELKQFEVGKTRKEEEIDCTLFQCGSDYSRLIPTLESRLEQGANILWICNTVSRAQEIFTLLAVHLSDTIPLYLFHSRYTVRDRAHIEGEINTLFGPEQEKRPRGTITISTQTIEQSLDVDFDFMISEIAPIDLLLQRVGRMFRHERWRPPSIRGPEIVILIPVSEQLHPVDEGKNQLLFGIAEVYEPYLIYRTIITLAQQQKISLPRQYRELVEAVYGDSPLDPFTLEGELALTISEDLLAGAAKQYKERQKELARMAQKGLTNAPHLYPEEWQDYNVDYFEEESGKADFLLAKTRHSDGQTVGVIILFCHGECYSTRETVFRPEELKGRLKSVNFQRELAESSLNLSSPQAFIPDLKEGRLYREESDTIEIEEQLRKLPIFRKHYLLLLDEQGEATLGEWSVRYNRRLGLRVNLTHQDL